LINVPIGIAVIALIPRLIPQGIKKKGSIDYPGALTITASLGLLIYSIVTANENGWTSVQTTLLLSVSIALFVGFVAIEKRSKDPLIPLQIFKTPNLLSSNIVMSLLGASWVSMWFFLNLYLQQILHYGPLESGLALLPMTGLIMIIMTWLMPRIIGKLGVKENLIVGLGLVTVGLILFSFTPTNSDQGNNNYIFLVYVLPASIISALGMSFSYIPILVSAISNARNEESGIASGLVNTTYQIGSAVGLAIMVTLSTSHSDLLIDIGTNMLEALNQGFHLAFIGAAIISSIASITTVSFIKTRSKE
jgi:predicted MFS family arabinose efflux permease